jgi:hypothetical protein
MDSSLLTISLLGEAGRIGIREDVESALSYASWFHLEQTRMNRANYPRTPYIEHPLRNTLRIIRWHVTDRDTILASIFHDVVEDCSKKIMEIAGSPGDADPHEASLQWIGSGFGAGVSDIVSRVTNPIMPKGFRYADMAAGYAVHFRERILPSPKALVVKASDLCDNAGSLHHHIGIAKPESLLRRARKYEPVVGETRDGIREHHVAGAISQGTAYSIESAMDSTLISMQPILAG